jgi:acyl-homoserine lactone acylase PvdQ
MFGEKAVEVDRIMRILSYEQSVHDSAKRMDHKMKKLLQQFADGVNYFVHTSWTLPLEFWIIGTKFESWKIEDSI